MPAVNLSSLPTLPYVYAGTTLAGANTCQLITLPNRAGMSLIIHNRDKASKSLRISFDSALTQGGAAPSVFFTIGEPQKIPLAHTLRPYPKPSVDGGFPRAGTLAVFSDSASVNYELLFVPMEG